MILIYSIYYISDEYDYRRFLFILIIFVLSIFMLILRNNYIGLLLGWDGLGISSYCLVIFYMNNFSDNAGMLTVLSNRLGDVAILILLSQVLYLGDFGYFNLLDSMDFLSCCLVIVAGMTKRAQVPFSAWLPAAIAAPTPVSSLVHSSTLVTAGVYLLIRRQHLFCNRGLQKFIFVVGVVTILIRGLGANMEVDLKKVVALSTLSQLGVIFISLGAGQPLLCFFHLITHALFKSSLFMCVGFLIHSSYGRQDGRMIGGFLKTRPLVSSVLIITNLSLFGFPFISGFYSKDILLEQIYHTSRGFVLLAIVILGTGITLSYSVRLLYLSLGSSGFSNNTSFNCDWSNHLILSIIILSVLRVAGGYLISWGTEWGGNVFLLTSKSKYYTAFICFFAGVLSYIRLRGLFYANKWFNSNNFKFFSRMWFLTPLSISFNKTVLGKGWQSIKFLDLGWQEFFGGSGGKLLFLKASYSGQLSQIFLVFNKYIFVGGLFSFIF